MNKLPIEIIESVSEFLRYTSIVALSQCNKRCYNLCKKIINSDHEDKLDIMKKCTILLLNNCFTVGNGYVRDLLYDIVPDEIVVVQCSNKLYYMCDKIRYSSDIEHVHNTITEIFIFFQNMFQSEDITITIVTNKGVETICYDEHINKNYLNNVLDDEYMYYIIKKCVIKYNGTYIHIFIKNQYIYNNNKIGKFETYINNCINAYSIARINDQVYNKKIENEFEKCIQTYKSTKHFEICYMGTMISKKHKQYIINKQIPIKSSYIVYNTCCGSWNIKLEKKKCVMCIDKQNNIICDYCCEDIEYSSVYLDTYLSRTQINNIKNLFHKMEKKGYTFVLDKNDYPLYSKNFNQSTPCCLTKIINIEEKKRNQMIQSCNVKWSIIELEKEEMYVRKFVLDNYEQYKKTIQAESFKIAYAMACELEYIESKIFPCGQRI